MATAKIFQKDISPSEYKLWTGILRDFTDASIGWAFDVWNRNGKFFPKPAEILELIAAFGASSENQVKLCGKCHDGYVVTNPEASPSDYIVRRCECLNALIAASKVPAQKCDLECKRRHGRGYGEGDIKWLIKERMKSSKPWTDADYEIALQQLDKVRTGGAPEFRR
jgi:hypothetical protein